MEGTWAPVLEKNAAGQVTRMAWYFNDYFPWLGMLFCAPIIGLWYWCTDQYIVQRALGAPNQTEARRGSIFAAFLKLFPVYLFIIPGPHRLRAGEERQGPRPRGHRHGPRRRAGGVPADGRSTCCRPGLRGLVVAGLLSALMGSLAGVFNACSTLFTVDLYEKCNPGASQEKLVRIGRTATVVMVLIALAWMPVIQGAHGLYNYLQSVQSYLAPPMFVVFFLGVFWKRMNVAGLPVVDDRRLRARASSACAVDTPVDARAGAASSSGYTEGSFLWIVNKTYFQYFSVLITLVSGDRRRRASAWRRPNPTTRRSAASPTAPRPTTDDEETRAELGLARRGRLGVRAAAPSWARTSTSAG